MASRTKKVDPAATARTNKLLLTELAEDVVRKAISQQARDLEKHLTDIHNRLVALENRRSQRMPRYEYRCRECDIDLIMRHLASEPPESCPECNTSGSLTKLLTTFMTPPKPGASKPKVGQATEKFIIEARSELKQYKKELGGKK